MEHRAAVLIVAALSFIGSVLPVRAAEKSYVGLTVNGSRIESLAVPRATSELPTVLLIGGLMGADESSDVIRRDLQRVETSARTRFRLMAIPVANPDQERLVFPPTGMAYRENAVSHALWRWIGINAPDLVLVAGKQDFGLAKALSENPVAGVGRVPARIVEGSGDWLDAVRDVPRSDAAREIARRKSRSPRQLAEELSLPYGHDFDQPLYIQAVALIGQLRLGHISDVQRLVEPFANGSKDSFRRPTSAHLAGHLVFAELAERTGDPRYTGLVRRVADLGFTESGEMKESMPLHDEMSDAVFMSCPILAKAGKLTGDRKYFDLAARHLAFMQKLCLRQDGLYRHSPLAEAAWGRGNAFPALGLAFALSDFPHDHAEFAGMQRAFERHIAELARFQDASGMWHEVIDEPASYPEFSATAMIATAMLRGIHNGWLDANSYQPRVDLAWRAISARTDAEDAS